MDTVGEYFVEGVVKSVLQHDWLRQLTQFNYKTLTLPLSCPVLRALQACHVTLFSSHICPFSRSRTAISIWHRSQICRCCLFGRTLQIATGPDEGPHGAQRHLQVH